MLNKAKVLNRNEKSPRRSGSRAALPDIFASLTRPDRIRRQRIHVHLGMTDQRHSLLDRLGPELPIRLFDSYQCALAALMHTCAPKDNRRSRKPSSRWIGTRSCTNYQTEPLSEGQLGRVQAKEG